VTPDELAAIRARDAHLSWFRVESTPSHNPRDDTFGQRARDRRALLLELDRIRAAAEGLPRLWANRITSTGMESVSVASVECVERAAVLAAIDGDAS